MQVRKRRRWPYIVAALIIIGAVGNYLPDRQRPVAAQAPLPQGQSDRAVFDWATFLGIWCDEALEDLKKRNSDVNLYRLECTRERGCDYRYEKFIGIAEVIGEASWQIVDTRHVIVTRVIRAAPTSTETTHLELEVDGSLLKWGQLIDAGSSVPETSKPAKYVRCTR